ncbi:hypothetical protein KQI84_12015 [bacterium]|nr:hypothetical protein [bacterium]
MQKFRRFLGVSAAVSALIATSLSPSDTIAGQDSPRLIANSVSGTIWEDLNADGFKDPGEAGRANWTVYLDLDQDGVLDAGEDFVITDANGDYTLQALPIGTVAIAAEPQAGFFQTYPNTEFNIEVVFPDSSLTPSQQAAFETAAARWESILIGDIPNIGDIDDLRITAKAVDIDGASGILAQAAATVKRLPSYLPAEGFMQFDTADIGNLEATGDDFVEVITHEMGHVLGVGSIWPDLSLIEGAGTADPRFTGSGATLEYNQIFSLSEASVPVEQDGGSGTRDKHWDEETFGTELMTGTHSSGETSQLSRITAASMRDMGYEVSMAAADPYSPPAVPPRRTSGDEWCRVLEPEVTYAKPTSVSGKPLYRQGSLVVPHLVTLDASSAITEINFGIAGDSTPTPTPSPTPSPTPVPTPPANPLDCGASSMLGQPSDAAAFALSSDFQGKTAYDDFDSLPAPICEVRWWGLFVDTIGSFTSADIPADYSFDIAFYADDSGLPAATPSFGPYTVVPTIVDTGEQVNVLGGDMAVYRLDAQVPCVDMASGWISIKMNAWTYQPHPIYLWLRSNTGNGLFSSDGSTLNAGNVSLCLSGVTTPYTTPGGPDSDGDGFSDALEEALGSSKNDPNSRPDFGDFSGDGLTNMGDAIRLYREVVGGVLNPYDPHFDADGDGDVDENDAVIFYEFSTGRIGELPSN